MPDSSNTERAARAARTIAARAAEDHEPIPTPLDRDAVLTVGGDLIADLLHLADLVGLDGDELVRQGLTHWRAEQPPCQHRPDDSPGLYDRCKDCAARIVWVGPSHTDWHTAD